ncbi:crosslink repair DNA glycosylase YcaQ family protein [Sphingomonas sp.]|uniref:winged helix-turn-helix domain-containing protein n=1 Tax=Sphingomonas sp. TaxID=28214 RepID=UPI0025F4113D|nr:crosslink repair DNA glycosylase YcaQ family protein [Sphingomonas sp.]
MADISLSQARRIVIAAQGFGGRSGSPVRRPHLARLVDRLSLHQIDSVNIVARAHYLPAFSRLGCYDRDLLDTAAWGGRRDRRLFEYWAHEASLLPLDLFPLMRWRMARADRGEAGYVALRRFATEQRPQAEAILARIATEGPLAASDFPHGKSRSGWWEWGDTKRALEWLFYAGHLTTATRRRSFERVYDLTERVIPANILALPAPDERDARRQLIERAARALGVATAAELRDYFRLKPVEKDNAIGDLADAGVLRQVRVEGWGQPAFLHRDARVPRRIAASALLAPFDPLIWHRDRTERLFGFRYRIEIYTPAASRVHGYYVLPFLMDERLVARVDLKADRQHRTLLAKAHFEPDAPPDSAERLRLALGEMASWLQLDRVTMR